MSSFFFFFFFHLGLASVSVHRFFLQVNSNISVCLRGIESKGPQKTVGVPLSWVHSASAPHLFLSLAPKPGTPSPSRKPMSQLPCLPPLLGRREGFKQSRVLVGLHLLRELCGLGSLQSLHPPRQSSRFRPAVEASNSRAHPREPQVAAGICLEGA